MAHKEYYFICDTSTIGKEDSTTVKHLSNFRPSEAVLNIYLSKTHSHPRLSVIHQLEKRQLFWCFQQQSVYIHDKYSLLLLFACAGVLHDKTGLLESNCKLKNMQMNTAQTYTKSWPLSNADKSRSNLSLVIPVAVDLRRTNAKWNRNLSVAFSHRTDRKPNYLRPFLRFWGKPKIWELLTQPMAFWPLALGSSHKNCYHSPSFVLYLTNNTYF